VRSKTVIIIKNIPFNTELDELRRLFVKMGTLGRLVMPPSRTVALVEFIEASEAQKAFKAFAYKKFKHVPLYLEWAPMTVFQEKKPEVTVEKDTVKDQEITMPSATTKAEEPKEEEETEMEGSTLFVKNLSFETKEESLKKVFETIGELRAVTIAKKKDPKKKGGVLSMGYGLIEYKNSQDAKKAIKQLQNTEVDGFRLELKVSHRTSSSETKKTKKKKDDGPEGQPTSKIIVKNVPFEATSKELKELFSTYGQVKRCRLPKKFDGKHRGFAFVDFVTKQEAKNAMDALFNTHLYGRHLVLQWAKEEHSLEETRIKTAEQFQRAGKGKKRKLNIDKDQSFDQMMEES